MSRRGWRPFNINPVDSVEATISATDETGTTNNLVETSTSYNDVSEVDNAWVTDAIITSSEEFPQDTKIFITDPSVGGSAYVLASGKTELWLSDILYFQNASAPRRTKLNSHTAPQVFNFTVELPSGVADITADLTFKAVTSDLVSAGSRQSNQSMTEYTTLGTTTLSGVTFNDG